MSLHILIDSCFWIALLDPRTNPKDNELAKDIYTLIENHKLIVPFPTLYEFVNSRLSRKEQRIELERIFSKPNIQKISAEKYKEDALNSYFSKSKFYTEDKSLVDEILILMMDDVNLKVDYLISLDGPLNNVAISKGKRTIIEYVES